MTGFDANEHLTPFRDARGYGAILFDRTQVRQPEPAWFDPEYWGAAAQPVSEGGRGGAWFIDSGQGDALLRHYLRGGLMARFSRDRHLWRGIQRVRSFAEYRLLRALRAKQLPVPLPFAAWYRREGLQYQAAILMQRLRDVRSLAALAADEAAPWEAAGQLIARFHRAGLDHADLNAHNLLFDAQGRGWMIDFDRSRLRIPATGWREANLQRLRRSLHKQRGMRSAEAVEADFARLRTAYAATWARGY
ncbi:3-deoxy-D-manno-octulosonic acid kinase [Thermomonas alba]|uniref:3-deoxy-D-manno-octulosonic acid kinase n=1 Tax=Thermomonas alba TaxID=2888525 RepID=UPI001F049096|nr:3-deoxy-D-manno-octulosonic acid kinase [Thermomonas alba]